jgi:hypothetical protein
MLAIHGATAQGLESIRVLIVVIMVFIVVFWKIMLQILIIVMAAMVLIGAVTLFAGVLHFL